MLKLHFSTLNRLYNSGGSKRLESIHPKSWMPLFIILISLCCLVTFTDYSSAYALSQCTYVVDYETPTTHGDTNVYQPVGEGQLLEFTVSASDPDGDPLTFSVSALPEGASFNTGTGTFSWTPRYDQAGVYVVRFEVTDGELSDYEDVTITVVQQYEDWDVNGDESANVLDMILVGQHWDETGLTGWIREDVNEDGTISVLDMIIIGQNWTG